MSNALRTRKACQKQLLGRVDQRFCNDTCRNNYNRYKRQSEKAAPHPHEKEIIKILKTNYQLLKSPIPGQRAEYDGISCGTAELIASGINTKFYTSSFHSGDQEWFCVFDMCYTVGKGEITQIVEMRNQADV